MVAGLRVTSVFPLEGRRFYRLLLPIVHSTSVARGQIGQKSVRYINKHRRGAKSVKVPGSFCRKFDVPVGTTSVSRPLNPADSTS